MLVCRPRDDYGRKWKVSAAFNVSQKDLEPLELFRDTLGCGTIRKAGNGGWYWEVNRLSDIASRIVPFFDRFPLVGRKARDFRLFKSAVELLSQKPVGETAYRAVLELREQMNGGGKRRYSTARILRDYTPTSPSIGEMR
jgi:hypothetical protein